jgi:hypothetical protein
MYPALLSLNTSGQSSKQASQPVHSLRSRDGTLFMAISEMVTRGPDKTRCQNHAGYPVGSATPGRVYISALCAGL